MNMDKHKFFKIVDELASNWYIDSEEPVTSKVKLKDGTVLTGMRQRQPSKDKQGPNWTGWAHIISWQPVKSYCAQCQEVTENPVHQINLISKAVKCYTCKHKKEHNLSSDSESAK